MPRQGASDADDAQSIEIARRWCAEKGPDWSVIDQAGRGGTAPVYSLSTPLGERALKVYDKEFSTGTHSHLQKERVDLQVELGDHACPSLVKVYEGGEFENRLFVLMSRAPGNELETVLSLVPREKIRHIVDQVARAGIFLNENSLTHRDIKSANIFVSDDFDIVTLLDLSVMRDIYDPVGLGTDHENQLPVVATARYSPPEYLFRLIDPGAQLWTLVDTYQMGALLHDLIMRKPIFKDEYDQAKENRYRFAYTVATVSPPVAAEDVDPDLLFLANQALSRDWRRRADLRLENFLSDSAARQDVAMQMLGFGGPARQKRQPANNDFPRLQRVAREVETVVTRVFREKGVTAQHNLQQHEDQTVSVELRWRPPAVEPDDSTEAEVCFSYRLSCNRNGEKLAFAGVVTLSGMPEATKAQVEMLLSEVPDGDEAAAVIAGAISSALPVLAVKLTSGETE